MNDRESDLRFGARNHLLVTDDQFVRGSLRPLRGRMADHLRTTTRPWLSMSDAEIFFFDDSDQQHFERLHIPLHQVIFAHEYIDLSGDPHLQSKGHAAEEFIAVALLGALAVRGRLKRQSLEQDNRFLTLVAPEFLTTDEASLGRVQPLKGLPWILIQRDKIRVLLEDEIASSGP